MRRLAFTSNVYGSELRNVRGVAQPAVYRAGHVNTAHGIVLVYAEGGYIRYKTRRGKRVWVWTENVTRTNRGIILVAHRLMRELARELAPKSRGRA